MARITAPDWHKDWQAFCERLGSAAEYATKRMV